MHSGKNQVRSQYEQSNAFYVGSSKGNVFQPFPLTAYLGLKILSNTWDLNIPIDSFDNNLLFSENFPSITREVQTLLNIWPSTKKKFTGSIARNFHKGTQSNYV